MTLDEKFLPHVSRRALSPAAAIHSGIPEIAVGQNRSIAGRRPLVGRP